MNLAGDVRLHLAFVIREEDVVESQAMARKIALKPVPNCDDFGIVSHRAQQKSWCRCSWISPQLKQR